jgi:MFS family permease
LGALAGALLLARRVGYRGMGRLIAASATGFGISLVLFSFSRSLPLSILLLFPVGLTMMTQMAASNTLIQAMVPDHLRGRVMAVYSMMFMGMAPFGALLAGSLANVIGAPAVVATGGAFSILAGTLFAVQLTKVRGEARDLIIAQQAAPGEPPEEITGGLADVR